MLFFWGSSKERKSKTQRCRVTFTLCVMYKDLDGQINCTVQICSAILLALSSVQKLRLSFDDEIKMLIEQGNGEIYSMTWHDLLRLFIKGVMLTK